MESQLSAPPVVAVVVTCDPGPWLEDALSALAAQDYPSLSVLVIDAASHDDPTPRVAAVLPDAYVRRLPDRVGFARAANDVLTVVEGASHFLFCHDDVAPAPDAVRLMVEEAFRSNAGIVCPKLVEWDHPDRLVSVGGSADKTGFPLDMVERGELDQEQHDAVRDVFVAPGGATLVRADLFRALGGFDPVIDLFGEDVDFSWRAQVAGARVVVNPDARVRHLEALTRGMRPGWSAPADRLRARRAAEEHRIRTVLTCYGLFHLLRVLPQVVVVSLAQVIEELLAGRPAMAGAMVGAWRAALVAPDLRAARKAVQGHRTVPDAELRRLQARGSARVRFALRRRIEARRLGPGIAASMWAGTWRLPAAAAVAVLLVVLIGSRGLVSGAIPGVGHLPVTAGGPLRWWHLWLAGWRPAGMGSGAPAPTALALLGIGGTALFGAVGTLQKLLVLGPLVLGPVGVYRAAGMFPSTRGRVAALMVYAAVPVPYNALAGGRWAGLVLYAAAPWLLAALCRAQAASAVRVTDVVGLGVLTALVAAFVPATLLLLPLVAVGLLAGSLATRALAGSWRAVIVAFASVVAALVLLFPWSLEVISSRTALLGVPSDPTHPLGVGQLLAFHTGAFGNRWLTMALLVAAALPLVIGTSWRLTWAARCWGVALVGWGVAWAAGRGWIGVPLATPEVVLSLVAAALALAVGLGVASFELDLPGYRFGWRQMATTAAGVAFGLSLLPLLAAASGGRWHLPGRGLVDSLSSLAQAPTLEHAGPSGSFRILWAGDPNALPLGSWRLADGVGYATSDSRLPDVTDQWPGGSTGATPLLARDLRLASDGETSRLGHLLAPLAVRYIVVPKRIAPGARPVAVPAAVIRSLAEQEDLRTVPSDESLVVYENTAWGPSRSVLPVKVRDISHSATLASSENASLAGAVPVLPGTLPDRFRGDVPGGSEIFVSSSSSARWQLSAGGRSAPRRPAFVSVMAFAVPGAGGRASLSYHAPLTHVLALVIQVGLWVLMVWWLIVVHRRRRAEGGPASLPIEELIVTGQPASVSERRPSRPSPEPVVGSSEDIWSDAES